ncbi:ArsI/CadI family heavy metal resistance metalloenzyme [Egicoccus sp. AB-alg6-2]|uniref:ArsI/CadI family heavy metal resistance metalloenzyme n=1 Tax=Egicoccus sp. AB-alg6-2 TaxID=3242692 RepID=UPI00359E1BF4
MSRVQLALDVTDLDAAVAFYTALFGVGPAKRKPGYANFAVEDPPLKLVLLEGATGGTLNHLGIEVVDRDAVNSAAGRLAAEGLATDERAGETCCYATQDKVWVGDPDGARWEVYTVLADADTFAEPSLTCC